MPIKQRIVLIFIVLVLVLGGGAIAYNSFGNPNKTKNTKTNSSLYVPPTEKINPKSAINKKPSVADQNQLEQKQPDSTQKGTFSSGENPDSPTAGIELGTDKPKVTTNKAKVLEKYGETVEPQVLPVNQPVDFNPTESQLTSLKQQLKFTSASLKKYPSNILADGTIILKVPYTSVKDTTWSLAKGLILDGDQGYGSNQDRVFILKGDKLSFAGDNVSNIFDFEYDGEVFWMSQYLDKIVISRPNFVDPQSVSFTEGLLVDIQKKNAVEFSGMFVGFDPQASTTKIYSITPQKYFIDGIVSKVIDKQRPVDDGED